MGNVADLVVLDSQSIIDRATFADPTQLSEGIDLVIVDGTFGTVNYFRNEAGARAVEKKS